MSSDGHLTDLKRFLSRLSPEDVVVLKKYFDIKVDFKRDLNEIARQFEATRQRIEEIEERAERKRSSDHSDADSTE